MRLAPIASLPLSLPRRISDVDAKKKNALCVSVCVPFMVSCVVKSRLLFVVSCTEEKKK